MLWIATGDEVMIYGHRNTEGLSDLGKRIINYCPKSFVNQHGQVIDPCHVWLSDIYDATKWDVKNER